jgi:hypothetical protein
MANQITRTFKYYLKLTKFQKKELEENLSNCNFLYNLLLGEYKTKDKNNQEQPNEYELVKLVTKIKKDYPFLKKTHSTALQEVARKVYKI